MNLVQTRIDEKGKVKFAFLHVQEVGREEILAVFYQQVQDCAVLPRTRLEALNLVESALAEKWPIGLPMNPYPADLEVADRAVKLLFPELEPQ